MDPPRFAADDRDAVAHTFAPELGDRVDLEGDDGRHLARVRRLRAGERVTVADGAGGWRAYVVTEALAAGLTLEATGQVQVEPIVRPAVGVAPALSKRGMESSAAQVTELGVSRIVPVLAARAVVRWDAAKRTRAQQRLERIVREASMQCRRARLPEVEPVADIDLVAGRPGLVLADGAGVSAADLPDPSGGEWLILSGPEGGFEPTELERLGDVPRLSLGRHVMRAETAPIAAVAALTVRGRMA